MKHKKNFKGTSELISNSQSLNPSINFTFNDPSSNIKGFAIRKKQNREIIKTNSLNANKSPTLLKYAASNVNADKKATETNKNDVYTEHAITNIKRKHKKDKQALALAKENNSEPPIVSHIKQTPKEYSLFNVKQKNIYVELRAGKSISEKVFTNTGCKFSDLPIHKYLVSNLEKNNFTTLTTVQEKAIPIILKGKDSLIRSQTGSGKTLAYALPIMEALQGIVPKIQRNNGVQALIVVPTRELALQTHELFNKINTFQWIVTGHLCGGENRKTEKDRLRKGVHILIGTPGRLLDHVLHTTAVKIDNVRCLVLDEADRLLDMGFRKDLVRLVEELDRAKSNSTYNPLELLKSSQDGGNNEETETIDLGHDEFPLRNVTSKRRQTILLSATLTEAVTELAKFTMVNHTFIDALDDFLNKTKTNLVIPDTVRQEFVLTYAKHRLFTLSALLISKSKKKSKTFVFMASTQMVEYHYELFTQCLVKMPVNRGKTKVGDVVILDEYDKSDSDNEEEVVLSVRFFKLHGNMDQAKRKEVFTAFREAKSGILLCTDVAARGLDVPEADCIIQYTGPQTNEDYLHRVGRTGRAGKIGSAIIFLTHEEQDYISCLNDHRVYLKQLNTDEVFKCLCDVMEEPNKERAAEALQRHYETSVAKSKKLHLMGCSAYTSFTRFYNTYPRAMREIFHFKKLNLGHYATSFALRETPSSISGIVKKQFSNKEPVRLNKKLSNFPVEHTKEHNKKDKQKRTIALTTSEYSSGLEPAKKKKKKADD